MEGHVEGSRIWRRPWTWRPATWVLIVWTLIVVGLSAWWLPRGWAAACVAAPDFDLCIGFHQHGSLAIEDLWAAPIELAWIVYVIGWGFTRRWGVGVGPRVSALAVSAAVLAVGLLSSQVPVLGPPTR